MGGDGGISCRIFDRTASLNGRADCAPTAPCYTAELYFFYAALYFYSAELYFDYATLYFYAATLYFYSVAVYSYFATLYFYPATLYFYSATLYFYSTARLNWSAVFSAAASLHCVSSLFCCCGRAIGSPIREQVGQQPDNLGLPSSFLYLVLARVSAH